MNDTFDKLTHQLDALYGLPGVVLTLLVCIAVGYLFKLWQVFPNKWIPLPVVIFGIVCNIGLRPPPAAGVALWQHLFRLGIVGLLLGVLSNILYDKFLKGLEERWTWLGTLVGNGSTPSVATPVAIPPPNPPKTP